MVKNKYIKLPLLAQTQTDKMKRLADPL